MACGGLHHRPSERPSPQLRPCLSRRSCWGASAFCSCADLQAAIQGSGHRGSCPLLDGGLQESSSPCPAATASPARPRTGRSLPLYLPLAVCTARRSSRVLAGEGARAAVPPSEGLRCCAGHGGRSSGFVGFAFCLQGSGWAQGWGTDVSSSSSRGDRGPPRAASSACPSMPPSPKPALHDVDACLPLCWPASCVLGL